PSCDRPRRGRGAPPILATTSTISYRPSRRLVDTLGEHAEQRPPAALCRDSSAHRGAADAVTLEVPVLEIDSGLSLPDRCAANLELARLGRVRLVAPFVCDVPRKDEAPRWVPLENNPPRAVGSVLLLGVAAAAHPPLDDRPLHRGLSDVVTARPPAIELFGEYLERALSACPHGDASLNGGEDVLVGHGRHSLSSAS